MSRYRPQEPTVAFSPVEPVRRRSSLHAGAIPKAIRAARNSDQVVEGMEDVLLPDGAAAPGDTPAFAAGAPLLVRGVTDVIHFRRVTGRG